MALQMEILELKTGLGFLSSAAEASTSSLRDHPPACALLTTGELRLVLWLSSLRDSICESSGLRCLQAHGSGVHLSAGLAGWILEKLYAWTDCHGNVEQSLSKEVGGALAQSKCKLSRILWGPRH